MLHAKRSARAVILACTTGLCCAQTSTAGDGSFYHYQARQGDTLIGLGHALLIRPSDWPQVARLNRIDNPRRIPIGANIRIPLTLMKSTATSGSVLAVVGEASLTPAHSASAPAQVGAAIAPGTEIRTGSGGYVTIQLADGSVLKVQSSTTAQLEKSDHYESAGFFASTLRLLQGRLEALVAHMTGGEPRFEVKTPQALLGVRGTDFRIAVDEARQVTRSEVLDGAVSVGAATSKRHPTQQLAAGFGTQVNANQGAIAPVPLIRPPDLSTVPALHERLLVRINVPPMPGATLYRAQVAHDSAFQQVQDEITSASPEFRFATLPDAHYYLRVRVADSHGIEGPDAIRQFHLKARPEPPIASLPKPGGKLRATSVALTWAAQIEASHYHLQVSQAPGFQQLVIDKATLTDTQFNADLPVGDYVWRVASIRPEGDQGPFGDPQSFQLRAPPPQPAPPKIDDKFLSFNWSAEAGQTFEFQLARDEAFAHPMVAQTLHEPAIQVDRPDHGGRLFIRYRAIDADGFVGPFTTPQVITLPTCVQDGSGACLLAGSGGWVTSPW
jgi:hypothetical protein